MNIFVGNLSRQVAEADLKKLFEPFGEITSVNVIKDKFSGESRGFGFVEMAKKEEAEAAMKELNGKEVEGQQLIVNEARPKADRGGRGGGRGRQGGQGGGRW